MGVYNTIKSKNKCPKCGSKVEWQSKNLVYDGYYLENALITIKLKPKMHGEMHSFCDKCDAALDIVIKNGKEGKVKWKKIDRQQFPWRV